MAISTAKKINYEEASPAMLAEEPNKPTNKDSSDANNKEWENLRSHLETRLVMLRQWRNSWWYENWANLAQYILPRRSIWMTQSTGGMPSPNNMTRGRQLNSLIKDPTATYAARVCSAGLMGGLASPSRPWFKITTASKNIEISSEGRRWMDSVEERLYTVLSGSNFYNAFAQECEDEVVFGTAPSIIYEDEKDIIRCYNPAVGEYYLATDAASRIDGLYRQFVMTVSQMVGFFGLNQCPIDVQKCWQEKGNQLEVERIVAHAIEPNFEVEGCPAIPGNFTWREVYWVWGAGSREPLSKRGFVDQPFSAARWSTQSNDAYGRSPGMDVLPDVMQLQLMTLRFNEAIEKQVRPPLIADMSMKNSPSSTLPGHITFSANLGPGTGMRPIYTVLPEVKEMAEVLTQVGQRIKVGLFNDLFLMLESAPTSKMTAYEVAQKLQEKLQVLGPVIENIITESLKPKLKRIYGIMQRKGMFPPIPESMKKIPIDVEFISMLALAQKASATGGLERLAALIGNLVAVYPNIKFIMDEDAYVREFNDLLANPEKILRGPEQVQALIEGAQKQQQAATAMAAAQHGATTVGTAANAAQVLSNTQVGAGQNALQMAIGGGVNKL